MLNIMNTPAISIFLATISPTVALMAVNTEFFSRRQMRNSVFAISGVGLLLAILFSVANSSILTPLSATTQEIQHWLATWPGLCFPCPFSFS